MTSDRHIYGLRAVERMTGIPKETILEWEERHGVAKPVAGVSGEMLYSRDDVETLLAFSRGEQPEAADAPDATRVANPSSQFLVLLAERDPYAADLTEYFLRTEGFAVATAFTTEEARRHLGATPPDIAIVEPLIEGGAGFSLVEEISQSGACPVIVLSPISPDGHPSVRDASAILSKPVRALDLVSAVRDLLGTSALVRGDVTRARVS